MCKLGLILAGSYRFNIVQLASHIGVIFLMHHAYFAAEEYLRCSHDSGHMSSTRLPVQPRCRPKCHFHYQARIMHAKHCAY